MDTAEIVSRLEEIQGDLQTGNNPGTIALRSALSAAVREAREALIQEQCRHLYLRASVHSGARVRQLLTSCVTCKQHLKTEDF